MLDSQIFLEDIQPLNEAMGLIHQVKNVQQKAPLMAGEFRFHTFSGGLSMHASNAIELQDSDSALELPPGLSFNLIFEGRIDFSIGGHQHQMSNYPQNSPASVTTIINQHDEILTRHMAKDVQVKKLNIFVEKKWLLARCQSTRERETINLYFDQPSVLQWLPTAKTLKAAYALLEIEDKANISSALKLELNTISLLSELIYELENQLSQAQNTQHIKEREASGNSLKAELDRALSNCQSINDIAAELNMSTRTLQRKFKDQYQIPASNYIKQRRMELAKKALLIDDLSIGEASFQAGYNHSSNFVSAFKRIYGLTPTEYKKVHRFD